MHRSTNPNQQPPNQRNLLPLDRERRKPTGHAKRNGRVLPQRSSSLYHPMKPRSPLPRTTREVTGVNRVPAWQPVHPLPRQRRRRLNRRSRALAPLRGLGDITRRLPPSQRRLSQLRLSQLRLNRRRSSQRTKEGNESGDQETKTKTKPSSLLRKGPRAPPIKQRHPQKLALQSPTTAGPMIQLRTRAPPPIISSSPLTTPRLKKAKGKPRTKVPLPRRNVNGCGTGDSLFGWKTGWPCLGWDTHMSSRQIVVIRSHISRTSSDILCTWLYSTSPSRRRFTCNLKLPSRHLMRHKQLSSPSSLSLILNSAGRGGPGCEGLTTTIFSSPTT